MHWIYPPDMCSPTTTWSLELTLELIEVNLDSIESFHNFSLLFFSQLSKFD